MRRVLFLAFVLAFVLVGCGGSGDTTVGVPPQATAIESSDNAQINTIITQLKQTVPQEMEAQKVKPETIEQNVYRTTASLQDVQNFYSGLTQKGWNHAHRIPGVQNNILYDSYSNGNTSLIVTAFDASALGGNGVIIYTAKGTT
ncbi:MAG TPA: hypothetical protein VFT66_09290 [Roseiflexaceae bacterium]|jgi:hypothetical protein|nr:hypothetical protein [Roseiflexaceae bacterium]